MPALLAECLPERKQIARSRFEALVHKIGANSTKDFFERHVEGSTPLPLRADLAAIAIALTDEEIHAPGIEDVAVILILGLIGAS